jgi:hypothetical protein
LAPGDSADGATLCCQACARRAKITIKPAVELVTRENLRTLLGNAVFRRVVLVAALVLGSHAMHDTFSVIR